VFLCKLQTKRDSAGIWVLEKHSPHQSVLFFSCFFFCISYLVFLQVYKTIFTSPSSVKDILHEENDAENMPPTKSRKTSSHNNYARRNVASKLHLNNKVTPRSIAYATVQVCVFVLYVARCLSVTASCTSICKLRVHGLQFTMDSTTRNCITMSLISLRTLQGLLQRSAPRICLTGGQSECPLFSQRILD
jgi:hypothetical protein